ncbi:hypothetical protein ACQ4OC_14670 [Yersinia sp. J1]|uniref:hypothetical protein n=1 Tax=Yersinia sp. J1 TaxID=3424774 RepID=UPI003D365DA2
MLENALAQRCVFFLKVDIRTCPRRYAPMPNGGWLGEFIFCYFMSGFSVISPNPYIIHSSEFRPLPAKLSFVSEGESESGRPALRILLFSLFIDEIPIVFL